MLSPFVTFVAHPSGAVFASFPPWSATASDVAVWETLTRELEVGGVPPPRFQLEEGHPLHPDTLKDLCSALSGIQNSAEETYAIALTQISAAVPGTKIFRPKTIVLGEAQIQIRLGENQKPWEERLFDSEEARHFNFYPMYHDLKEIFLQVIRLAVEQFPGNQTVSVPAELALFEDAEGLYRFRLQDSEEEDSRRGLSVALEVKTDGTTEPAEVRIGCRLKLLKKDEKTVIHQELYGLMNHLFWIFDNYNEAQAKRKGSWLRRGSELGLAGTGIKFKL